MTTDTKELTLEDRILGQLRAIVVAAHFGPNALADAIVSAKELLDEVDTK